MKDTIKNKEQFQRIYSEGKKFSDNNILICVMPGTGKTAFVAGKKLGCAPVRNRLKRLLRETYRLNSFDVKDDVDIIFVARAGLIGKKLADAAFSFNRLKKRAGIVR